MALVGLACLGVAGVFRATRNPLEGPGVRLFACVCMSVGTAFQAVASFAGGEPGWLYWFVRGFGWVLIALGMALFRVDIDRMFGRLGATKSLHVVAAGSVVLGPVLAAYLFLPRAATVAIEVLLPVGAALALRQAYRVLPVGGASGDSRQVELPIPVQFAVTSLVQGVVAGIFYGALAVGVASAADFAWARPLLVGLSLLLGAGSSISATSMARYDFNRLIYKMGFPAMALSLVLLATCPACPWLGEVGYRSAAVFSDLVLWSLGAYIIKDMGMPACWIASLPGAALFLGTSLGASLVWIAQILVPVGTFSTVELPLLGACLLLAASLFLLSERNMRSGWGTFRLGTEDDPDEDLDAAVALIAGECGLTAREADVVGAFARRLTRKEVAETLCVGDETVKTHLRGIYRKTGAHGQDELVSLVEKTRRSMRGR